MLFLPPEKLAPNVHVKMPTCLMSWLQPTAVKLLCAAVCAPLLDLNVISRSACDAIASNAAPDAARVDATNLMVLQVQMPAELAPEMPAARQGCCDQLHRGRPA